MESKATAKAQLERERAIQSFAAEELARTKQEKYNYKPLAGGWFVAPVLTFVIGGIIMWLESQNGGQVDSFTPIIIVLDVVALVVISHYDDKWKNRNLAKQRVKNSGSPSVAKYMGNYRYGYIYTDSIVEKRLYLAAKIFCYLLSVAGIGILSILLFSWLGTLDIAPTTIIIILLVIIIINQENGKQL